MAEGRSNQAIARAARRDRARRREARDQHLRQARPHAGARGSPPRAGGADLPALPMTRDQPSVAQLEALLAEQAALRRVATLVAADPDPGRLFEGVCEEVGASWAWRARTFRASRTMAPRRSWAWGRRGAPRFPARRERPAGRGNGLGEAAPERQTAAGGRLHGRPRRAGQEAARGRHRVRRGRAGQGRRQNLGRHHCVERDSARLPRRGPRFGSPTSRSWSRPRSPTSTRASSWPPRAPGSSRPAMRSAAGSGRDLHDGAQQELVGAVISLKLAQRRWAQAPDEARDARRGGARAHGVRDPRPA